MVQDGNEQIEVAFCTAYSSTRWVFHPILSWRAERLQSLARCDWQTAWALAVTYSYSDAAELIRRAARESLDGQSLLGQFDEAS